MQGGRDGGEGAGDPLGSWTALKAELDAVGFRPSKERGQNFLLDPNLARALVRDAELAPGDRVLEVGPGCGFLTLPLAEAGVELACVEIDERLAAIAARRVGERPNVRFLVADVLAGKHALAPAVRAWLAAWGPWHLVSNLPYAIAGPLIATLALEPHPPRSMTLVVQEELAQRLTAEAGSEGRGALTVKIGLRYRARTGRRIDAGMFRPRPRVHSRQVRLVADPQVNVEPEEAARFGRLVDGLFSHRRKTLRKGLGGLLGDPVRAEGLLREVGIDPRDRPETLPVSRFVDLLRALEAVPGLLDLDRDASSSSRKDVERKA